MFQYATWGGRVGKRASSRQAGSLGGGGERRYRMVAVFNHVKRDRLGGFVLLLGHTMLVCGWESHLGEDELKMLTSGRSSSELLSAKAGTFQLALIKSLVLST
ncbi:hypothetical protein DFJ77DRAFT_440259 [Powellomyces hirtus]|nr:hypothetical protein DFJ77DRAFT_440259 [Powellomyces hirtus]